MTKKIDFFAAPLSIYKSILGGIIPLLICSASLFYTVWIIYSWHKNQFSPKILSSVDVSNFSLLDINYDLIKLCFYKYDENMIDPFETKVLLPLITYTENYTFTETKLLNLSNETSYYGNKYIIPQMRLGFTNFNNMLITTSEIFWEKENNVHLKKSAINFLVNLRTQQQCKQNGSIQSSIQEFFVSIEKLNCNTLNTFLQSSFYEVKDSILFGSPKQLEHVNGALIQPQTNKIQYCKQTFGIETYASLYVVMKGNQIKTLIEYPNAGDLLANIGLIVSLLLFMFRHIIFFFNTNFLNEKIINDMIFQVKNSQKLETRHNQCYSLKLTT
ncbi:unnamed protein product [Paramecium sonneborni]|uniref:Transmembrane protein n=1 Tax=Paramecium sonneborni TaxID=65129 RepID=A0A8S1RS18_9CILI|nr:unnamed protein product [Paramecium sonneborni]